jgi:DnaJ family protein C protein 28
MSTDDTDRAVDRAIREAMERGEFDNLPGKGKPLKLGSEQDDDTWAARRILQNSGYSPDWIADRREIEAAVEAARRALARSWAWRVEALAGGSPYALASDEWQRAIRRFREEAGQANQRIRTYNLKIPASLAHLQLHVLNIEAEIAQVKSAEQSRE